MGHTARSAAALVVGALLLGSATSTGAALEGPPPVDPPPVEITASPTPPPEPSPTMRFGQEALFNYPVPGTPDLSISDALVDLVDGTPAGESITLSYFVVQPGHPVIDALLRAYSRGVSVKVVLDSGDGQKAKKNGAVDAAYATLAETLGTDGDSFARQCNRSCITDEPDSINHNKFAAFSRTGDAENVVFQGTGNLRVDGSGDSAYNAGVIIRGDQTTYQQYLGYFDDLYTERRVDNDNYHFWRPPLASGQVTAYFFPRTDKTDTVSEALRSVNCTSQPTSVRVMAPFFSRKRIRNTLRDMAYAGCAVQVLARQDTLTREFCDRLDTRKVAVKIAPSPTKDRVTIHAKYVLVDGSYGGGVDQRITWMGSHNFTDNALKRNDETFVQFADATVSDAFSQNFDRLWNDPSMSWGCSRAGAEDNAAVEKSGDTEVTKIARRSQTAKRALPKTLRKRQVVRPVRTAQGRKITTRAYCKRPGSSSKMRKQDRCRVVEGKILPRVVIRSDKPLRVRIVQTAKATKRLLPFKRSAAYRYMPKKSRAVRL
jgi:phosphatidylserine/phosphatidylglycerophosphate/cardiolipin synthase-like enzyme